MFVNSLPAVRRVLTIFLLSHENNMFHNITLLYRSSLLILNV